MHVNAAPYDCPAGYTVRIFTFARVGAPPLREPGPTAGALARMVGAAVRASPAGAQSGRCVEGAFGDCSGSDDAMQVHTGLDVSLTTTHICLMNEAGKIV